MIVDLINLDRLVERREEFMAHNAHLSKVRRCGGFDGRDLDAQAFLDANIIDRSIARTYTAGALGVALAHISLWERAISAGTVMTICEDDAIFHQRFEVFAERMIANLPAEWDVLAFGWNFDACLVTEMMRGVGQSVTLCDENQLRAHVPEFQNHQHPPQPFRLLQSFGALAYSVSPRGARALRDFCVPIRHLSVPLPNLSGDPQSARWLDNVGIDVMMAAAYPQLNAFVSMPPIAVSKNDHATSTQRRLATLEEEGRL